MRHLAQLILPPAVCSRLIVLCLAAALVSVLTNNSAAQACLPCAQMLAPGVGYFAEYGPLYWTTDNGNHWTNVTLPTPVNEEQVLSVFFLNTSTGWVLLGGSVEEDPEPRFYVAFTQDSGETWSVYRVKLDVNPDEVTVLAQGSIQFADAMHGWINVPVESGAAFHSGLLYRTVDGGKTWSRTNGPGTSGGVQFIDERNGWVDSGMNELWATHDGGRSWEEVSLKPPPTLGIDKLSARYRLPLFSNNKQGALLVDFSLPPADPETDKRGTDVALYSTADAGKTWKFASVVAHFSFPNSGIVAGMANSTLITTQRIGNTLTTQHIPLDAPADASATNSDLGFAGGVTSLTFATAQEGWILTYSATCVAVPAANLGCAPDQLFATADGGATWNNIMPGPHLPPIPPPPTSKPIPLVWKCCINPCKDAQTKQPVDCRTGKPLE
jgi:photosystem II stability/assembly factor-like uncharacterized protein